MRRLYLVRQSVLRFNKQIASPKRSRAYARFTSADLSGVRAHFGDAGYRPVDAQTRPEKATTSAGKTPGARALHQSNVGG